MELFGRIVAILRTDLIDAFICYLDQIITLVWCLTVGGNIKLIVYVRTRLVKYAWDRGAICGSPLRSKVRCTQLIITYLVGLRNEEC